MLSTKKIDNKSLEFIKENIENFPLHMQFYLLAKAEDLAEAKKKKKEAAV